MKKTIALFCISHMGLVSCGEIRSIQPVGLEIVELSSKDSEPSIAGTWSVGDQTFIIKVSDPLKGELILLSPDAEELKCTVRSTADHVFLNWKYADGTGDSYWRLIKINDEKDEIIVWLTDVDAFRKLITEGKIKGNNDPKPRRVKKVDGIDVVTFDQAGALINDPKGEWQKKMNAGEFGVLFFWKDPIVLRKKKKVK